MTDDAMKEREAVVAWLRDGAASALHRSRDERYSPPMRSHAEANAFTLDLLADAIERAEHLKEGR